MTDSSLTAMGSRALGCLLIVMAGAQLRAQPADTPADRTPAAAAVTVDMRPELKEILPRNRLVGKGRLTFWGIQVYDARLWAAPGWKSEDFAGEPFALELDYLRDFDHHDVADRSILEMRRSATISDVQAKVWVQEMMRVIPSVKKGDRVLGVNRPGAGALFLVNGKPSGEIRDPEFARLFFGIWLSPKTSEPRLRSALLAGAQ